MNYKEYWETLYKYSIVHRLENELLGEKMKPHYEELDMIINNYYHTYTYLHGKKIIFGLEEEKYNDA